MQGCMKCGDTGTMANTFTNCDCMNEKTTAKTSCNRNTSSDADVERDSEHASNATKRHEPFTAQVNVHFCSYRHRLIDPDNLSPKAMLDGIVHSGLLQDDSAPYVKEVRCTQEEIDKDQEETTVVTITEITKD